MRTAAHPGTFYVIGGTMRPDSPSYVERPADAELYQKVKAGELCYILTSRQMGKSSLMARTARRLRIEGIRVAIVDLTTMGTEQGAGEWYYSLCARIHSELQARFPFKEWWHSNAELTLAARLTNLLCAVAEDAPQPAVLFVDEIDSTIPLYFADDFFAAVRACHNARATDPRFEKLTFVLLGAATPAQLIRDPARTPFNVGHCVELSDFTPEESRKLEEPLHASGEGSLLEILSWTGGHPYLTQAVCHEMASRQEPRPADAVIRDLFLREEHRYTDPHLRDTAKRLQAGGYSCLKLFQKIQTGHRVGYEPESALHAQLLLTGAVKVADGRLVIRNRIYESVFGAEWLNEVVAQRERWTSEAPLPQTLEAVRELRELAAVDGDSFVQDLVNVLLRATRMLNDAGLREEALQYALEAGSAGSRLAKSNLPGALATAAQANSALARQLRLLGKVEDALKPAADTVALYQQLADRERRTYLPMLAASLMLLGDTLSAARLEHQSITRLCEAAEVYRQLAEDSPASFQPYLASTLSAIAAGMVATGQPERALPAAREAAEIYRCLAGRDPETYLTRYARSRTLLADYLAASGVAEEATHEWEEAEAVYRGLISSGRLEHTVGWASAANHLANKLLESGNYEMALARCQETIDRLRKSPEHAGAPQSRELAEAFGITARCLSAVFRHEEAALASRQGIDALRHAFLRQPQEYLPLMNSLLRSYFTSAKESGTGMDSAALEPILQKFQELGMRVGLRPGHSQVPGSF